MFIFYLINSINSLKELHLSYNFVTEISILESIDHYKPEILKIFQNQKESSGTILQQQRNLVTRHLLSNGIEIVIKSFRVPNFINQIIYKYFRKSKAKRSFQFAVELQKSGIGTPEPLFFKEELNWLGLGHSYYVSKYQPYDFTYRELTTNFNMSDYEKILRDFTRFTYKLHLSGINFLDHSPGNTLIKKEGNSYHFFLVDLNRMKFGKMSFEERIKNFSKLTIHREMVQIMSNEYAMCTGENEAEIFSLMWKYTQTFQNEFHRKRRLKRKLFFWRSKYKK